LSPCLDLLIAFGCLGSSVSDFMKRAPQVTRPARLHSRVNAALTGSADGQTTFGREGAMREPDGG
ncbi:MAG: hypothetical protein AAFY27_06765, partial [Pseudomonadota bacterium]